MLAAKESHLAKQVAWLKKSGLTEALALPVEVAVLPNSYPHAPRCQVLQRTSTRHVERKTSTLGELTEMLAGIGGSVSLCCLGSHRPLRLSGSTPVTAAGAIAEWALLVDDTAERIRTKRAAPATLKKHMEKIALLELEIDALLDQEAEPTDAIAQLTEARASVKKAAAGLRCRADEVFNGDVALDHELAKVRRMLGMKDPHAADMVPVLAGIVRPLNKVPHNVRLLVEMTNIRTTKGAMVCKLPLYAAPNVGATLVAIIDEECSEEQLRTAAQLWSPKSEGPLGSLAGALEVAQAL